MINIVINGCNGAMGRTLSEIINDVEDVNVVAGIDINNVQNQEYPVYNKLENITQECDVIIDFSNPLSLSSLLKFGIVNKKPLVIATTGISFEQEKEIEEASKFIPIFRTANTSLGINVLIDLVKKATNILSDTFDIEIIEKHHNKKIDSPSGTAKMIANAINEELDGSTKFNYGREGKDTKRQKDEIGIHAIRGGTIPGEHIVIFAGNDEIVEIKHQALSKKVFAQGAVEASKYIINKTSGIYNMNDLINNK